MTSPNPANHPLPLSPEIGADSSPSTVQFALPPDAEPSATSPEVDLLISELRASLSSSQTLLSTQATRLSTLADVETELSQLKDQYAFLSAAKEAVESQLQEEVRKREVAEENVELLRGQVEQARRGVMQLQKQDKERKRMSVLSGTGIGSGTTNLSLGLGLGEEENLSGEQNSSTTTATAPGGGGTHRESKLMKRQSIMARSHRRTSSQSEPGASDIHAILAGQTTTSPNPQAGTLRPNVGGLRELRLGHTPPSGNTVLSPGVGSNNPQQSGYFDDPPLLNKRLSDSPSGNTKKDVSAESEEELLRLRAELHTTQAQLHESEEARVASETCLRALREFIAASGGGEDVEDAEGLSASTADLLKGIRLPPLPTDKDNDNDDEPSTTITTDKDKDKLKPSTTGWAFKLWANKQNPSSSASATPSIMSTAVEPPNTPQALSPSNRSRAGSMVQSQNHSTPKASPLPTPTDEYGNITNTLTPSASASTITPLSSFVSNWTKNVSPGKPSASQSQSQSQSSGLEKLPAPAGTGGSRKLSMPSFFSRSSNASGAGGKKEKEKEKELPTPPAIEDEGENEFLHGEDSDNPVRAEMELEPSAQIDEGEGDVKEKADNRRKSHGTTVTDLEEELGTPLSLKNRNIELASPPESDNEGDVEIIKGKEKSETLEI